MADCGSRKIEFVQIALHDSAIATIQYFVLNNVLYNNSDLLKFRYIIAISTTI